MVCFSTFNAPYRLLVHTVTNAERDLYVRWVKKKRRSKKFSHVLAGRDATATRPRTGSLCNLRRSLISNEIIETAPAIIALCANPILAALKRRSPGCAGVLRRYEILPAKQSQVAAGTAIPAAQGFGFDVFSSIR